MWVRSVHVLCAVSPFKYTMVVTLHCITIQVHHGGDTTLYHQVHHGGDTALYHHSSTPWWWHYTLSPFKYTTVVTLHSITIQVHHGGYTALYHHSSTPWWWHYTVSPFMYTMVVTLHCITVVIPHTAHDTILIHINLAQLVLPVFYIFTYIVNHVLKT
jgi:hypothetical protein